MHRVIVCGEKLIAEHSLEYLFRRPDTSIEAVVTSNNDWQADLVEWAKKRSISVFVGNINRYRDEVAQISPDFLFSIQYRPLIKESILQIPSRGCFNLHFGLLPRYGGCYPVSWALLNGEDRVGVTLHRMTPNFDEGDVLAQQAVSVDSSTTARHLFDQLTKIGSDLFEAVYPSLIQGRIEGVPQNQDQRLYYTKDSIDFKRDSIVRWSQSAVEVQRQICAFSFEPFQLPISGIQIGKDRLFNVKISETRLDLTPNNESSIGDVVSFNDDSSVSVKCGDDAVIRIFKLDGRNPAAYLEQLGVSQDQIKFVNASINEQTSTVPFEEKE